MPSCIGNNEYYIIHCIYYICIRTISYIVCITYTYYTIHCMYYVYVLYHTLYVLHIRTISCSVYMSDSLWSAQYNMYSFASYTNFWNLYTIEILVMYTSIIMVSLIRRAYKAQFMHATTFSAEASLKPHFWNYIIFMDYNNILSCILYNYAEHRQGLAHGICTLQGLVQVHEQTVRLWCTWYEH